MPTWELHINGRVQGVGFRPFVYRHALRMGLRGTVANGADGVRVRFNASAGRAREVSKLLVEAPPPLAIVTDHRLQRLPGDQQFTKFRVIESDVNGTPDLLISPDFALCADCRKEIRDPEDRRYGYAFTTCTNCGPRFGIQTGLPYDRERTSMADFGTCPACTAEYHEPTHRRYYSQTNSCSDCGIQLRLLTRGSTADRDVNLSQVTEQLRAGLIVAIKNTGGYLLCCDARNQEVVAELRRRKARPAKPFAVLFPNLDSLHAEAVVSVGATNELQSPAAPIVLLPHKTGSTLARNICPGAAYLGAMLPNSPLLELLAGAFGGPLVATSGNRSGEPILSDGDEGELAGLADVVLTHTLPIVQPQDDSLVRITEENGRRIILRRARGLAPSVHPGTYQNDGQDLFAAGADIKGTVAINAKGRTYVSPYLGELSDYATQVRYRGTRDHLMRLLDCQPEVVLTDLHPGYASTQLGLDYAEEHQLATVAIQHHEAHFAALLGEHNLIKGDGAQVLGIVWDGMGYGYDGQLWGGEFLRYRKGRFERAAHLPYFPHFGGDKMATEPRYAAMALAGHLPVAQGCLREVFDPASYNNLLHLRSVAKMKTSSIGRVFDAVSCLLGLCAIQSYAGQAASLLEAAGRRGLSGQLQLNSYSRDTWLVELLKDFEQYGSDLPAARFHLTLIDWISQIARREGVTAVGFTGGCWQNALLVDLAEQRLGAEYQLYFHETLSPNDENLAYGQLVHYALTSARQANKQQQYVSSYPG